jgi:hypothetical protein
MNDQKKLSRGQFLTLLGGMALSVALFKLSSVKHVIAATGAKTRVAQAAYGNSTYGGKAA